MRYVVAFLVLISMFNSHASVPREEARRIFNRLNKISNAKAPPLQFMKCGSINAVTTKDGIYLCKEALTLNRSEVAMILGHELGHFKFQDVTFRAIPKSQEYRADHWGSVWTQQDGYNKCKTAKLFLRFYESSEDNDKDIFSSHPSDLKRYKAVSKGCK